MSAAEERQLAPHPLDPLSAEEIERAVAVLQREHTADSRWRYGSIELREPSKQALRDAAGRQPREALVVCWSRERQGAFKAVVCLDDDTVTAWEYLPGRQAGFSADEDRECDQALRRDPRVAEELTRRGIHDLAEVHFETWGLLADEIPEEHRGKRVGFVDVWHDPGGGANPYASPVSGLHFLVDLSTMTALAAQDAFAVERPQVMGEYRPSLIPGHRMRDDLKPLEIVQPDGVSFTLQGRLLQWQKWSMRLGFTPREGLVLHSVGYRDEGRVRPIAHRMSLAELVSPYRDPSPDHCWRMAFDAGEWGLGMMANSLTRGCDCLGEITYLDAVLHDSYGRPQTTRNAVCVHEEDDGVLWKHVEPFRKEAEVRRRRRLVVSFNATIANYDYLVYWRFYQDGSIECEVQATGIVLTTQFTPGQRPPYGAVVDERTYAPYHQHFIVARLDLDIDGERNTVRMIDLEPLPLSAENPDGCAVAERSIPLRTEQDARQDYEWKSQRSWIVVNDHVTNRHGTPVGYRLVPAGCIPAMFNPRSRKFRSAQAIEHALWVTPYAEDERWPCGEFVVQGDPGAGLPAWTAADRPIEDTDVVLWHVFGLFHQTRPEDWPVMPVDTTSFWLKPVGFFGRNPALDIPSATHCRDG